MKTIIIHANIITPYEERVDQTINIIDGKIEDIHPTLPAEDEQKSNYFDASGLWVTPGLIDIHIHGCNSADSMDASLEALSSMSTFLAQHGTTSFYATTVTNSEESIDAALDAIVQYQSNMPGANLLGAHIEGPYINIEYKGAQNPDFFRTPQPAEYHNWISKGITKLITIAPEIEGMDEFIAYCVKNQVELAIGHSKATYEQVRHASTLGVHQATHLFNGMQGLHHREPGTVGGVLLEPNIYAQIIVDGIHLHPAIVALTVRMKGLDKTILITDAIRATGLPDGEYELGGQAVSVKDGAARIANGSLAGSTLTLDQAVRNTMKFADISFQDAIRMATLVPAQAMKISDHKGHISIGADADLTFFDTDHQVSATMVNGKFVYQK